MTSARSQHLATEVTKNIVSSSATIMGLSQGSFPTDIPIEIIFVTVPVFYFRVRHTAIRVMITRGIAYLKLTRDGKKVLHQNNLLTFYSNFYFTFKSSV